MSKKDLIFIYGPPLVGKSTLGHSFARHLSLPFWDLDEIIVEQAGKSIPDIFSEDGESTFRAWEYKLLQEICQRERGVVALGGGALTQPAARDLVEEEGDVVFLRASRDTLLDRCQTRSASRPLLQKAPVQKLRGLLENRAAHYASFRRWVNIEGLAESEILSALERALGRFRVEGMGEGYDVRVRPGGLDDVGEALQPYTRAGVLALVTDNRVGEFYAARVMDALQQAGYRVNLYSFPAGEASKTMRTVRGLWDRFLQDEMERGSTVVSLGGGVVGDVAGFAAAVYHRGIPWVNLPTSLLAMVDASLGGKTGVDLPQGKNLVGAFHPPAVVWVDPEVLDTLAEEELWSGMAEVIKHGVIADPDLFARIEKGSGLFLAHREEIIRRAMAVKIGLVREDPFDRGRRRVLNFGHTVGHGVEHASGFNMRHGEAVAVGMVIESCIAEKMGLAAPGLTRKVRDALRAWQLPADIPPSISTERIISSMMRDKKKEDGRLQFSLPVDLGEVKTGVDVPQDMWQSALHSKGEWDG